MDVVSKVYLNWDEIHRLVNILCKKVVAEYPIVDSVMGLPRGGLIPAILISHQLDMPLVLNPTSTTLVVDDICDSGKTFEDAPGVYPACLHYKPTACFTPNIYGITVSDDWIVYPWERKDSESIQDYKLDN